MTTRIPFVASESVQRALSELGRTEDVKFSPDNRRIALAGFDRNRILIVDLSLEVTAAGKRVVLADCLELHSAHLARPHGLCFLDDDTIIVANRDGDVPVFRLPGRRAATGSFELSTPAAVVGRNWVHSPGSVAAHEVEPGLYRVLVCSNYAHCVSRHLVSTSDSAIRVANDEILLCRGLDIPDGVAVSHDRRWIAVSSHNTGSVCLFDNVPALNLQSGPQGILGQVACPHGLGFTPDDEFLVVADACRPRIHVYAGPAGRWTGIREPAVSFEAMDAAVFERGRANPREGGPKGIAIGADAQMLVTTSEHQLLAFFDLPELLRQARANMRAREAVADPSSGPAAAGSDGGAPGANRVVRRAGHCACGSGRRVKHCCGELRRFADETVGVRLARLKSLALTMQQAGNAEAAAALYRAALVLAPDEADCLHMLSVALYSLGRAAEAAPLIRKAGAVSDWRLPGIARNLELIVGACPPGRDA